MESFETYRPYLFSIAYRMLGSAMDAEDMVQETYIRYQTARPQTIHSLKAYLTTILVRLCMDQLQLARRKRELYVGPWLPEPILTEERPEAANPETRVETEESVSLAFLILLEKLQPFERAVFLLREVFEYEFGEIAGILEKTETACRRTFSRAKQHLVAQRTPFKPAPETHRQLLSSFLEAVQSGEMITLTNLLSDNVILWSDGGGKARTATLLPIYGREKVARLSLGSKHFWPENIHFEIREVNGQVALVGRVNGFAWNVIDMDIEHEQIQVIRIIANPEKLTRV
ncbi:RNA polymerase sigma-70 factor [Tengunoibacter tsumagoiensis]|uniref:DNA-directed RNA polymerase sigma-70 factor n=1 Tax=Tengunoibacter tsumagoiensis TaxID=2014871 RepID=A0A402A8I1_9CHLR|nr:RNA polymerase sigma-70 factor [Tengunoibacter tsumagoiensis]GCE15467.1 DNA-directed RNA polymerase sigma-70 factor [Tengunoibacter tsumagoiensis]